MTLCDTSYEILGEMLTLGVCVEDYGQRSPHQVLAHSLVVKLRVIAIYAFVVVDYQ